MTVPDGSFSPAKLDNGGAVSVFGRSANSSGVRADIAAAADDTVLRRVSSVVGFGQITTGMVPAGVLTYAMLASAAIASNSEFQLGTAGKLLSAAALKTTVAYQALTSSATVTWDMSLGNNVSVALSTNATLGNPTNANPLFGFVLKATAVTSARTLGLSANFAVAYRRRRVPYHNRHIGNRLPCRLRRHHQPDRRHRRHPHLKELEMSILVRKIDDVWQEWHGSSIVIQMVGTYTAVYGDGRQVETPCDPYPIEIQMNGDSLRGFYDQGIWALEEVEAVGGKIAVPFNAPDGKQTVGSPSYVETGAVIQQVYEVEDTPRPPAPPTAKERVTAMLATYQISVSELKTVLELDL